MRHNSAQHSQYVVFDLDSTLVTIEGIDELARLRGVEQNIIPLTSAAMNGELSFEEVFSQRLALILPTQQDLAKLSELYCAAITPGAIEVVAELQRQGRTVFIISGGYNPAVAAVAKKLDISSERVFANQLKFNRAGNYLGFDSAIPLWRNNGKQLVLESLRTRFPGSYTLVGDSMGDLEASRGLDAFICFAGVIRHAAVLEAATISVTEPNLTAILPYLL